MISAASAALIRKRRGESREGLSEQRFVMDQGDTQEIRPGSCFVLGAKIGAGQGANRGALPEAARGCLAVL